MGDEKCTCGERSGQACPVCGKGEPPVYWCEVCDRAVADKRCPFCGLKTRKMRRGNK